MPSEVAEELRRLTPEQRALAWQIFKRAVMEDGEKGKARRAHKGEGGGG